MRQRKPHLPPPRNLPKSLPPIPSARAASQPPRPPPPPPPVKRSRRSKPPTTVSDHPLRIPDYLPAIPPGQSDAIDVAHDWHIKLNHVNLNKLRHMAAESPDFGLPPALQHQVSTRDCHGCAVGHIQRKSHQGTVVRPPPGHTIAVDIAGGLPSTFNNASMFLTIVEIHTRMLFVTLLSRKSESEDIIFNTIQRIERHFDRPIARVRCDNAKEFLTKSLIAKLAARATTLDPTVPHSPQENSIAERINRTLLSRVRTALSTAALPFQTYWSHCLLDCVVKYNSTLHDGIQDTPRRLWNLHASPYSPFPLRSLDLNQYHPFGAFGHIPVRKQLKPKHHPRAILVRYLFSPSPNRFRVIDSGRFHSVRMCDFRPYNPNMDPQRRFAHPIPNTQHFTRAAATTHTDIKEAHSASVTHVPTSPQPASPPAPTLIHVNPAPPVRTHSTTVHKRGTPTATPSPSSARIPTAISSPTSPRSIMPHP